MRLIPARLHPTHQAPSRSFCKILSAEAGRIFFPLCSARLDDKVDLCQPFASNPRFGTENPPPKPTKPLPPWMTADCDIVEIDIGVSENAAGCVRDAWLGGGLDKGHRLRSPTRA